MPAAQQINRSNSDSAGSAALLKEIEELKNNQLSPGEIWFLIDLHWYKKMIDFLQGNSDFPGPIDNSGLLEDNSSVENPRLKEGLQDELDYVLLPERAWNMLLERFGILAGQAPIQRRVIDVGLFVKHQRVEVYPLELNLALYKDQDGAITVSFSRTASLKDVMAEARAKFQLGSAAQIHLYQKLENDVLEQVSLDKTSTSLQDLSFSNRQTIVVDVEENGKWHVEATGSNNAMASAGPSGTSRGGWPLTSVNVKPFGTMNSETPSMFTRGSQGYGNSNAHAVPGLCGLTNLGNTCFMNSALQCMSNAVPLTDYFLSDQYKGEINETNPLGMRGEIAQAFGELLKQMWSGRNSSVIPRAFKSTVGRFAPQFSGYQQQDSQELMAFLLDGLHEDLNRVRQKPYVEIKDADGQPDEIVATDAWNNYKKRNDSIIVDLFHGLLKSTVVCPECDKISVTFDPFCYLSLPLPAKKERQIILTYVPLNQEKPLLKCKVTVPKGGTINDLTDTVARMVGANSSQLVVCDIYGARVYKLFESETLLSVLLDRDEINVYEVENVPQSENPVMVILYNRIEKISYLRKSYMTSHLTLTGLPIPVILPKNRLTLEHLKAAAEKVFGRFLKLPNPGEEWWRSDSGSDSGVEETDNGDSVTMDAEPVAGAPPLYVMRVVNSQGTSTFEEMKLPNTPISYNQSGGEPIYVALDWHPATTGKFLDGDFQNYVNEHESFSDVKVSKKTLNLDECLDLFTTTEKLGQDDLWFCPRCKKHQPASKKFDLWSLPDVLIIHLKRFSYTRYWRDKIEGLIDYPLKDLDLSKWVINKNHPSCVYDLIAISNHYGGLGGGHYTAYGKNKTTGKWYSFDDSHVSPINESEAVTKSGYVLVYNRRRPTAVIDANTDPNVEMEEDGDDDE